MKYCENCHVAADLPRCPLCGGKKLREVKDEDYCFLTEMRAVDGEMLADVLRGNGIECVAMPSGNGVRPNFSLWLDKRKLFVPWQSLEQAKAYMREVADTETEKWRQYLLENADKLHISPKLEKKAIKKSKGACGESVIEFCRGLIANAGQICDGGGSFSPASGVDLICYAENVTAIIASETFEILSISLKKQ
ncbi:MAG TPA: hypothetical protein H9731_04745 [Candidatus Borkfalkia excrementipullorum]|nr:hypothetical protein [Candidatus Borkfalkia excrementipullorum]